MNAEQSGTTQSRVALYRIIQSEGMRFHRLQRTSSDAVTGVAENRANKWKEISNLNTKEVKGRGK